MYFNLIVLDQIFYLCIFNSPWQHMEVNKISSFEYSVLTNVSFSIGLLTLCSVVNTLSFNNVKIKPVHMYIFMFYPAWLASYSLFSPLMAQMYFRRALHQTANIPG